MLKRFFDGQKWLLCLLLVQSIAHAELTVEQIIEAANAASYYPGDDARAEARMKIVDAQGRKQMRQFMMLRQDVEEQGAQNFMVVFSRPADVKGTVLLVNKHIDKDDDRWLYLPGLDLVKRIAAGDKRTSFVGSHFFYEDVSGRLPSYDHHQLTGNDEQHYILRSEPKADQQVAFAHYVSKINKQTMLPDEVVYFNDKGKAYRKVEIVQTKNIDGFNTVTAAKVSDLISGAYTQIQFRHIKYNLEIPSTIFSERSLRNPPAKWLKR
ncbi:outer membrane lipoprotein-sorting protein [Pleionea sp. CnH1-48]|uniref:outer membrane lipoprotein-sorting protein n=1 Tax=Pleionea sp. CnH1-48 TaxID=2954494 RepID=UPI0020973452|nr:outer membrane lipoprotein-sorting protein [Pleionea sp. CnH1-48]MCO7224153.1 outer membrane lipoprotein-sorting protein [Pleionea sp. CnH1-48]